MNMTTQTPSHRRPAPRHGWRSVLFTIACTALPLMLVPASAWAGFGFVPGSVSVSTPGSDGTPDTLAGSHPFAITIHFAVKTTREGGTEITEGGEAREVVADLPPGMFGNPSTIAQCSRERFEGDEPLCPVDTQIGVLHVLLPAVGELNGPIYNLAPAHGVAAQFGYSTTGFVSIQYATIRDEETPGGGQRYRVRITVPNLPTEVSSVTETIWGAPADPGHDPERYCSNDQVRGCSTDAGVSPYLTLPGSCQSPPQFTLGIASALDPETLLRETVSTLDGGGNPITLASCESVPFTPTIRASSTNGASDSPGGLDFELKLPDQGLLKPDGTVEAEPKKAEVLFPQGMAVNPSTANGTSGCTLAQYQATTLEHDGCPVSSQIGTVTALTPLLEEQLEGGVYLAAPHDNPFSSLLAVYLLAKSPQRGILIKQAGLVHADPITGQLTAVFDDLPPLPYSSFAVKLREGPRAPLITPQACGTYTTQARLYPFSNQSAPVTQSSSFKISSGPNGGACASNEAQLPNSPSLQAGTVTPVAGAFSPFVFKVSREDGTQHLGAITASLPEGLLGKVAGVPYCSDAQIAAATARSNEGEGALEQASPSCPEASQVGVVNITAGAGSQPYAVQGKAYLAGPYKNAPLSVAVITPAIAGPFDLGTVVVRVALYIDQNTAQIHAVSDPLPTILDGIPLDLRSVSLSMNRAGFTFNPTSCEPMSVGGEAISTLGQTAGLSNRFQVGGCQGLPFKPAMAISTQGKTSKANGASFTVKLSQKPGEANIHKVDLTLPTVLPARLTTLQQACTEAQFNANPAGCPSGSFIGTAKAVTPILSVPLTGPAILVSHGGAAFPDVVFLLQANERGANIRIDLDGRTDIKKGITYSRFETVPDAPISSFETNLPQGPHSVLSANGNLCTSKLAIPTELSGQNGAKVTQSTKVTVTDCPKAKVLTRAQKLKVALKACHKKPKGRKRQTCEKAARHKYGPVVKRKGKKK